MAKQLFVNNFTSTFIANVAASASTGSPATELGYGILQLNSGAASFITNPTGGDYYLLTAYKRSGSVESNIEVMKVTAVDNSVINECRITVTRAQEGTSAQAYVPGDYISLRITKGGLENFTQPDNVQALSNKTLNDPTVAGDVTVTGTGKRFNADFSNATPSLRYAFKTSTSNGSTIVGAIPDGTGTASYYQVYNASDLTNASYAYIGVTGSVATINSGKTGSGTALPLVFSTDSSERFRLDASSNRFQADFSNATIGNRLMFQSSTANGYTVVRAIPNGTSQYAELSVGNASDTSTAHQTALLSVSATEVRLSSSVANSAPSLPLSVHTGGFQSLNVATDGTFTSVRGAIGYGTGAGGNVEQPTSKSTAVTLNKPSGTIKMNAEALGAGATNSFAFYNSFISGGDLLLLGIPISGFVVESAYSVWAATQNGLAVVFIKNISGSSLSEPVVLTYSVFKAATS